MKQTVFLSLAAFALTVGGANAQSFTIEPGKYSIVSTMTVPMMPNGMTSTTEQCITAEDASKTPEDLAQSMSQNGDCEASNINMSGKTMSYDFACTGSEMGDMSGSFTVTHDNTSYTMKGTMSGNMGGMSMDMKMDAQANRVGPC